MLRGQTDEVHARHGCPSALITQEREGLFCLCATKTVLFSASFFLVARAAELRIVINNIIIIRINIKDHCFSQAN